MSHLFWLDQEHINRIQHMFPNHAALRGLTTARFSAVSSMSSAMACDGVMHQPSMVRTRRSTIGLSGGHALVSLRASSGNWQNRGPTVKSS